MSAECSLPALSTKTRESNPSGARGLSSIHYMRSDNSMFMILDALIWACCADGKDGIRAEDMQNGGRSPSWGKAQTPGLRFLFSTRWAHHSKYSTSNKIEQNATSPNETWRGTIYLAEKCVHHSHQFSMLTCIN